jgi:uncharacterized membrane protein
MNNRSAIGRIFFAISIAAFGLSTLYYRDFPYFFLPPDHPWLIAHLQIIYLSGALLFLAGADILIKRGLIPVALSLGTAFLLLFLCWFVPSQIANLRDYREFAAWENSAKELALAGGAFALVQGQPRIARLGAIIFALTILSFGLNHYLYAKAASAYMPGWIPAKLFWMYLTGTALSASGIGMLLNIRTRLAATLLGIMIFIWILLLHIPKSCSAPLADNAGEVTSGFLALAYCGTAFIIAGTARTTLKKV